MFSNKPTTPSNSHFEGSGLIIKYIQIACLKLCCNYITELRRFKSKQVFRKYTLIKFMRQLQATAYSKILCSPLLLSKTAEL